MMSGITVGEPRFKAKAMWQKSKQSFEMLRSRSFEIMSGLLGSFGEAKQPHYDVIKALPCYQDQPHFHIESLGFTAVQTEGGFLLFRPLHCQLCKGQSTIAPPAMTKKLSWSQVMDYREKEARQNSLRSGTSSTSSEEEVCQGQQYPKQRRNCVVLRRAESTEYSRTTTRTIEVNNNGSIRAKRTRKWRGPGSSFLKSLSKAIFG